jgi:ABC-type multidrug transport system fused ATPase/permease subunit
MVALFRIENPRAGQIVIDGMDIADMPLRKLRSKVVIIPQDAVLFAKTVRFNVDPFDWYSDEEIWTAFTCVNLHETVRGLPKQLGEEVSEGGANFSAGQRQVLTL